MAQGRTPSGLPSAARARLAEIRSSGTWGSALSTNEFAALRTPVVLLPPARQPAAASADASNAVAMAVRATDVPLSA